MGLPRLNISEYYTSTNAHPPSPSANLTPDASTLPSQTSIYALMPNAWLPVIQIAIVHRGERVCKIQPGLAHFARLCGSRTAGRADSVIRGWKERNNWIVHCLFELLERQPNTMGWMREGGKAGQWDRFELYDA